MQSAQSNLGELGNGSGQPMVSDSQRWQQLESQLDGMQRQLDQLKEGTSDPNQLNLVVFEGYKDRLMAAFVIATGAAACGMDVRMFFTFWATPALRKEGIREGNKSLVERAFGWMLPSSAKKTKLSQMDFGGLGRVMMQREMNRKNVCDLEGLIETAAELDVNIQVCEMSMQLMGIRRSELIDYPNLDYCGVATFVGQAAHANTTMFI
ncbi:DsrE/DsrF/DrsH-like family protein [Rhodopirellula sp. JC740]|uniref:DsrE/DsrF/DrsH-like family protein n=1 Tax=Rhodopirellula halodulae TaxID=2894198 RepID=A0ABS8NN74_9BACT|nr:DsrE/DsrF/DrsH-like family protein [Rhodopirellula sp. JC740]MCC9644955.1 DsrE/DsrF/DrsH-like family protein [Rhodopirellula sp. JC740]